MKSSEVFTAEEIAYLKSVGEWHETDNELSIGYMRGIVMGSDDTFSPFFEFGMNKNA